MKTILLACTLSLISFAAFALNPSRTYKQLPDKFNMKYTEHKVKTNDGKAELVIWDFPCSTKQTTELILIAHNGEGNMADYLRRVDAFRGQMNVVIFDYRGYGKSSEFEIDNNMYIYPHFQDDMETMIDWCRKQHVQTFNLYGFGIGAGMSLGIGFGRPEVKKIIADTPFLSMEDLETRFEDWDEPMEVPFAGYEKRFEPSTATAEAPGKFLEKVLLIVGSNDIIFKTDDMKGMMKVNKTKFTKEPYVVENPDRRDNFKASKDAYVKRCLAFLSTGN